MLPGRRRNAAACPRPRNPVILLASEVSMRRLRYGVAMSLDGFIAGPNGEYDWIVHDPAIDFAAIFAQFDALLMGRRTYEIARTRPLSASAQQWIVVSRTLK